MHSSEPSLHSAIESLRGELAALKRRESRRNRLTAGFAVVAGALLSWATVAANEAGKTTTMTAPFEVVDSKGKTLLRVKESGLQWLDRNGSAVVEIGAEGVKLPGKNGAYLQLTSETLKVFQRANESVVEIGAEGVKLPGKNGAYARMTSETLEVFERTGRTVLTADGVGAFSSNAYSSITSDGVAVAGEGGVALMGEGQSGKVRLALYAEGQPMPRDPQEEMVDGVTMPGHTPRVALGITPQGQGGVQVNDERGQRLVDVTSGKDNGGSVAVFKDSTQPQASIGASAEGGQVTVHGSGDHAIASLSRAREGGMLQLTDHAGQVTVGGGTINGIGIVRAGPSSQPGGILGMGLPGSYIMGKRAE